jgi:hypothetical protein
MYPSAFIESEERGEEYSSVPFCYRCPTCKHEEWDRVETDLSRILSRTP